MVQTIGAGSLIYRFVVVAVLIVSRVQATESKSAATNITKFCDCPVFRDEELTINLSESIAGSPEYKIQVSSNGVLRLPAIEALSISNQTHAELAGQIKDMYRNTVQTKSVLTVTVLPTRPFFIFVGAKTSKGAVAQRHFYTGQMTLMRAVATTGGFTDFSRRRFLLIRSNGERIQVDLKKALRDPKLDPIICPGDTIMQMKSSLFGD